MKNIFLAVISSIVLTVSCSDSKNEIKISTSSFQIAIDKYGIVKKFLDVNTGINYLSNDTLAPLLSLRTEGELSNPESATYDEANKTITLNYKNNIEAKVECKANESHISFQLTSITSAEDIELVIWGPYPTTINKVIGETIGVVQGEEFAIGIQSLNPKTLGGYPWNESDCLPQINIFNQDDFNDLSEHEDKEYVLYRVEAAKPTSYGSSLQAYCRNRNKERIVENLNHKKYVAPVYKDGGVIGSKMAIFGCLVEKTLETIGEIELAEGLPHPMINGEWAKKSKSAASAYIIFDFGEDNIEEALEITKKAGLKYLYHPDPFESWGHFKLKKEQFPSGIESMKKCVEKAEKQNIMVGLHTLSNFITINDPYVTPIPDKRLAKVGSSVLTEKIDKTQTKITIENPDFFNQFRNNHLKTVVIGNELIRYGNISKEAPKVLLDCERGAFGTKASEHYKGDTISKLTDHGYKVFLTNTELSIEVAKNIADLFNKTGLRQISFDGIEGNQSTGMGSYGEILFTQTWYDNLSENIKKHYIADASRTSHYFWHMYTRMNWGEPWYAGFRESQTESRMKNQKFFKRNLMPAMLGWFKLTEETSIEDIEWMLARSAAFDAGYAFVIRAENLAKNKLSDKILGLLGEWEEARLAGVFTSEQKQRMEDLNNEFQLKKTSENEWELTQVYSYKFKHEKKIRQPGEPLYSIFEFENPSENEQLNFILKAENGEVKDIKLEIDDYKTISLLAVLKENEILKYTGGDKAIVYTSNWEELRKIDIDESKLKVSKGQHKITFDCSFTGGKDAAAKLEVRLKGEIESVKVK